VDRSTYCVGLGGVEVGADDAVFLDLSEEDLCVGVRESGRHFGNDGWVGCGRIPGR
jgi:hypothetical protein